jgi:hypothetical protein
MDLDLEWIAFGSVVGMTAPQSPPGQAERLNQSINLGEKFDEIAGPNGALCLLRWGPPGIAGDEPYSLSGGSAQRTAGQSRVLKACGRPTQVRTAERRLTAMM